MNDRLARTWPLGLRSFVLLQGGVLLVLGILCSFRPHATADSLGFGLHGLGPIEYIAIYGGMEIGIAAYLLLARRRVDDLADRSLFLACFYAGIIIARLAAWSSYGGSSSYLIAAAIYEGVSAIVAAIYFKKARGLSRS